MTANIIVELEDRKPELDTLDLKPTGLSVGADRSGDTKAIQVEAEKIWLAAANGARPPDVPGLNGLATRSEATTTSVPGLGDAAYAQTPEAKIGTSRYPFVSDMTQRDDMITQKINAGAQLRLLEIMLAEFEDWQQTSFGGPKGTLKSIYERLASKVGCHCLSMYTARSATLTTSAQYPGDSERCWERVWHHYHELFYRFVDGLESKGAPDARGVKLPARPVDAPRQPDCITTHPIE